MSMSSKKIMKKIIPSIFLPIKKQQHHHPETLIFKTHNSIFLHPAYQVQDHLSVPDFCLTLTSSSNSDIDHNYNNNTDIVSSSSSSSLSSLSVETIIRGAVKASHRDRLFFEPEPGRTSSILLLKEEEEEEAAAQVVDEQEEEEEDLAVAPLPFKESVALALESEDPYRDFKESMREMVESEGLKNNEQKQEWESLEELLGWYLRMNNRMNHGIIVGAFVDLLLGLAKPDDDDHNNNIGRSSSTSTSASSYSSADSCFSSPRSVVTGEDHDIQ